MAFNILVCDDEPDIVSAIDIYLRSEGYFVFKAYDGLEALDMLTKYNIHLLIIDVMMPKMNGIQTTVKIREEKNIPIIILSAKSEDTDKVLGLNVGADDYISKPFNPIELIARVRSHLRRYADLGSMEHRNDLYNVGEITMDDSKKFVSAYGKEVNLTPNEYGILKLLMQNANRVFSSNQIYEQVWGEAAFEVKKTVSVHISHLREKIELNPKEPDYIKSVYGMGYKITGDKQ